MHATGKGTRRAATLGLALLLVVMLLGALAGPALALDDAKITIKSETGGVPTRFTFVATLDPDAPMDSITFTYPEGFDLGEGRTEVVTLDGLTAYPCDRRDLGGRTGAHVGLRPKHPCRRLRCG